VAVFLGAGSEQNRHHKDDNNHGNDEERGSYIHRAASWLLSAYQKSGSISFTPLPAKKPAQFPSLLRPEVPGFLRKQRK
jgi:hypothetical protein